MKMKKNIIITACLCCYCLFSPHFLKAQNQLQIFKNQVEQAINNSKAIQNATLENKKVQADNQEVKGKLLPHISMNAMYGYLNTSLNVDLPTTTLPITGINLFEGSNTLKLSSQLFATGATVSQVIFSGLQISNGQKALNEKYKAQELMTQATYDPLAQEIIHSFDQLMLLDDVEVLINDSEKRLNKEHLKVIRAIENGLAIPYDRDKIKLAMLELDSKRAELQSNRDLLYFKLQELTGITIQELKNVKYDLSEILIDSDATEMNRKELEALEASSNAYKYVLKKEKGARLPMVFGFGNVSYANAFNTHMTVKDLPLMGDLKFKANHIQFAPTYAIGVGVKWNIFDGNARKSAIEKAQIDIQINENKIQDTKEKLALLQRKTESDYKLAIKKLSVNKQQVAIAKNNLHLASRQFEEGLLDVTERLEAENEFYKQSLNYYNQILNQRLATTELLKSNGNLYQTIIR